MKMADLRIYLNRQGYHNNNNNNNYNNRVEIWPNYNIGCQAGN